MTQGVGSISFTVTAGAAGTVTIVGGGSTTTIIPDGNYQVNIVGDNSGTTVSVATPYGAASNSDIRQSPSLDS
jgi:hypothetical protein